MSDIEYSGRFRLQNRKRYPWLFALLVTVLLGALFWISGGQLKIEHVVSALGAAGGFTAFLYTQHLQETRLFTDLFQSFNKRYDGLNERLNRIAGSVVSELSIEDTDKLMDYFNLCSEEYLYLKAGYIDAEVWQTWVQGMRYFARSPAIRTLWESELASGSYYGFTLRQLDDA